MTEVIGTISQIKVAGDVNQTLVTAEIARKVIIAGPAFVSAEIGDVAENKLVITFDAVLNESIIPATTAFSISGVTGSPSISSVSISGVEVTLTLSGNADSEDIITVSYAVPDNNPLQDADGMPTPVFIEESVTNNISANVIINGTFDTDSDWTKEAGWAITGGKAVATATIGYIYQTPPLVVGETYEITFTVSDYSGGGVRVRCGTKSGITRSANGTFTQILECTTITIFYIDGVTAFTGKIDNVVAIQQ